MMILVRVAGTITIACVVLLLQAIPSLAPVFEFDWGKADPILSYRLLSCHLLHWSWNHLAWDLLMFVLLGAVCETSHRHRYYAYLSVSALVIPVVVLACHPNLATYRGLSGIDTGLFSLLAIDRILESRRNRDLMGGLVFGACFIGMVLKIICETIVGSNLFVTDSTFTPVPISHLTGAIIGAWMCWVFREEEVTFSSFKTLPKGAIRNQDLESL